MTEIAIESFQCPLPLRNYERILLGHGSGGRMMSELIEGLFVPLFSNPYLDQLNDQAVIQLNGHRLAFTTDSFVVSPIFFPGGDIGSLAVHGTINDLAMGGAQPLYLSAGFILEEGLPISDLERITKSMALACREAGVALVTGDTKVVDKGSGDLIFINTAGLGLVPEDLHISADQAKPGDMVIVSGAIGVHGIAIMSMREGLEFEAELDSDSAALHGLVGAMLSASRDIHCLRDPTRGGLASTLNEIAARSQVGVVIDDRAIPVWPTVKGACEMLGLDPLYVANEGKLVAIVDREDAAAIVEAMRAHPHGLEATIIGQVVEEHPGLVVMRTGIGGTRVVHMLAGEMLPRIC